MTMARTQRDDLPRFLFFAALWHLLWGAFLIPYALVAVLSFGGQDAAQHLVDGLARTFLLVPVLLALALPVNLAIAAVVGRLLGPASLAVRLVLAGAGAGGVWFLAAHAFLAPADFGRPFPAGATAWWAAGAGLAYGVVLAMG